MSLISYKRTAVIEGPLAYEMRRLAAARTGECGLQILPLPQVAARLAGGFLHPVTAETFEPAVQRALGEKGFAELDTLCELPGMTRAIARTLRRVWAADIDLRALAGGDGPRRVGDLALIERRVKNRLPFGALLPRDLRDAALNHVERAPAVLGPVRIEGLSWIAPLWRPLVNALCNVVPVEWDAPTAADVSWFAGSVKRIFENERFANIDRVSCADPRHEVVESLRWARELVSTGRVKPCEIAIAAASTDTWDEHFVALSASTGLRIHFSHGIPALSTRDGQRCAALADVLLRGLSEQRVSRLVALSRGEGTALDRLPAGWREALPRGATLAKLEDWQRVLEAADSRVSGYDTGPVLLPLLNLLSQGAGSAREAGAAVLRGRSLRIWEAAMRAAPPHAIELSLQTIRLPDEMDPGDSVVWCPAGHLATSPRAWVRLLGLTSHAWPRRMSEDSILPDHILSAKILDPDPIPETDRRTFDVILGWGGAGLVLSRSRRSAQGNRLGPSPLLGGTCIERDLQRARVPEHAFSEADRLTARPVEAAGIDQIRSASRCWRNWHSTKLTSHDGKFDANHPILARALSRVQSPTSLKVLLRSPLGFVWKYALGWRSPQEPEEPLTIPADEFGKLVHELLRRSVDALEPMPGFTSASDTAIEAALRVAVEHVLQEWSLQRSVPPRLLWVNTVEHGARMALAGLRLREISQVGTRSWTEVPFGDPNLPGERELPWDAGIPVEVPGTQVHIKGTIDRLDLRRAGDAVRVTDYKTGQCPKSPDRIVIGGGAELQRPLYALACRQLLPECRQIVARLVYLAAEPRIFILDDLDAALRQISDFVALACKRLTLGVAVPGPDADRMTYDLRLALPASPGYWRRKRSEFAKAADRLPSFWSAR